MDVIQFPLAKGPLDFDGMGIKIDVKQQRENWDAAFTSVQTALRFCNFDHMEAEEKARAFIDDDIIGALRADWADSVEYLESIVAIMKVALARAQVSEDRALGRKRKGE